MLLAGLGVLVTLTSVVTVDPSLTVGHALEPWPDGPELLDVAVNLVRDGSLKIHVAGEEHPSRYPCGYSLVIAAALACGVEPAAAPNRVNQLAALVLLLVMALAPGVRGKPIETGLAVLLLATLPAFVILGRSPLSELCSSLLVVSGVFLLLEYTRDPGGTSTAALPAERGGLLRGGLGAALLGLSLCVRLSNLFFAGFIVAAVLARHRPGRWRPEVRDLLILGAAFLLAAIPLLVFNELSYGSPLSTGYGYWVPFWSVERSFDLQFLLPNLEYLGSELGDRETLFSTASIYGQGSYLAPALVLAGLMAAYVLRRERHLWWFGGAALAYVWMMLLYFYQDARLLFPVLVLVIPVVAVGTVGLWRRARPAGVVTAAALAIAVLGWPWGGGFPLTDLLRPQPVPEQPALRLIRQLGQIRQPQPPLVLTDMPPPLLHALMPPDTIVAPVQADHLFQFNPQIFTYSPKERLAQVTRMLDEGRPVWAVQRVDILSLRRDTAVPRGHVWEIVTQDSSGGGIARLVPR